MLERRKEQRWPAYLAGVIVCDPHAPATACLIRNTSPCGAQVVLEEPDVLPGAFSLHIPARGQEMRVRACWRGSGAIGVETVPAHRAAALDRQLAHELGRLELLQVELRRLAADLSEPRD